MPKDPRKIDLMRATPRDWNTILNCWRLCQRTRCARARRCCGDVQACITRNHPLLPKDVRAWFEEFGEDPQWGLTHAHATVFGEYSDTLYKWDQLVAQSLRPVAPPELYEEPD